jgi:hypothetical protein
VGPAGRSCACEGGGPRARAAKISASRPVCWAGPGRVGLSRGIDVGGPNHPDGTVMLLD